MVKSKKIVQQGELSFGRQVASIYLPTMIYETGIGAVTPVIPLMALQLHASPAIAAFIVALLGIGQVVGDIPAGVLATKLGDRKAMLYGAVVTLLLLVTCAFTPNWMVFAFSIFILGMVNALFVLARQAYLTEVTPPLRRSLSLSILGGMTRIGSLIGPFVGGAVMSIFAIQVAGKSQDWLPGAFWAAVVLTCLTWLVVFAVPEIDLPKTVKKVEKVTVKTTYILRQNWRMFATLGFAILLVGAVRQTSNTALPLWAAHIGLNASMTSYIYGLSGLLDALLFYPAGKLMDRYGRLWVAIPSMLILGGSILFIPLTHGIWSMAIVSLLMGLGNSIGAGMIMTISADMAPASYRAQFLATCRLFGDTGAAAGPLLVAAGAGIGFLAGGIWLLGGCGLLSALILGLTLEKYSIHANQRTRLKNGLTKQGHPFS
ncbi:MFS transporter [Lactococcus fujiensis]|uniref:Major facilitator superfamily protein n=1 Tax=Lactococcus fujiensis JCM 16395 TaxID=1291764 RepID=A0A2A5RMS5_9LACT|nr:MFS transporter [Lactococcus fujiensis]PCS00649.1 major facilitator superfamily protein [Lactococcus fujiensis JCM 16395]